MSKAPLSTTQLRAAWGPPCSTRATTVRFFTGVPVTVEPRIVEAFAAFDQILRRHGYRPRGGVTGAYVCRAITGASGYSLHAYKIAIDINWDTNPYSAANRLITDMPRAMVNEIVALRTRNGAPVWGWGGFYRTIKDTMHFEIVCTPADLATGIATVRPLTSTEKLYWFLWAGRQAKGRPYLHPGSTGDYVRQVQRALDLQQTGHFGPATLTKVKAFQAFLDLEPADGRVGYRTWQWLIYDVFTRGRR